MITYYKKLFITNVDNLCEAIHCSLTEILTGEYALSVKYHAPSLQIRIVIGYADTTRICINLKPEEYVDLLNDTASQWDYGQFIAIIKDRIKEMILKDYIR